MSESKGMLARNLNMVLDRLTESSKVLVVGGWYIPFNRANHVVDLLPYETRGVGQGTGPERFTEKTWIQLDVCGDPLPFEDDAFDFVVCSHTLEDIRDPLFLCAELNRVGKAGYLETPSIAAELTFGIESKRYAGWYHHRWLVEMRAGNVTFRHKPHLVHGDWRYHLPKRWSRLLSAEQRVTWMLWDRAFSYAEDIEIDKETVEDEVAYLVKRTGCRPEWRYNLIPLEQQLRQLRGSFGQLARGFLAERRL